MIENGYHALKEQVFAIIKNGLSLVSLADKLSCTPSVLQLWLNGDDNIDLNGMIYAFLSKEKVKNELLNIPFTRISPFTFIESVIFEAMYKQGIYALIGSPGTGKTASLLECLSVHENIKFLYSTGEINKLSTPHCAVICIDNAEDLTIDQADVVSRLSDQEVSVILCGTPQLIKKISHYEKLALKTVIRDVPGIDQEDVKRIVGSVIDYPLEKSILQNLTIISIPSIARLVLILKEAYRIMKKKNNARLSNEAITEAKKSLIVSESAKW